MTPTNRSGTLRSGVEAETGGWRMEDGVVRDAGCATDAGRGAVGLTVEVPKPIWSGVCSGLADNIAGRCGNGGVKFGSSIGSRVFSIPGSAVTGGRWVEG